MTENDVKNLSREELENAYISLLEAFDKLNENMEVLIEQLKISNQARFGRSSEANVYQAQLSLDLDGAFNECEFVADLSISEPEDPEEIIPNYKKRSKKNKGKREADLAKIMDIRVERHDIPEEELDAMFDKGYKKLPDYVYKRVEYHPAGFEVVEHHVAVYTGKDNNDVIIKAKRPVDLFENSVATPSLVAAIINGKFTQAMPLYRQEQAFMEKEINLSRQTMGNWIIKSAERYLSLVTDAMKDELKKQDLIHADETTVKVRKDGRENMTNSYMWVYRSNPDSSDKQIVLFDYQKTRNAEHPKEFLKGFEGYIMCDGYAAYHKLDNEDEDIDVANCWVHARRRFANICKTLGSKNAKGTLAQAAVDQIASIYHIDNQFKELEPKERLKKRQKMVKPLVDVFFQWVKDNQDKVPEKSETGKGITYCLNQEKYLRKFLENPIIPLDNNPAERSIRPFVIGKHNFHVIDTLHGAEASAICYSLVETAKANHLKLYSYIKYLLEEIPQHLDDKDTDFINDLLPWSDKLPENLRHTVNQ